MDFIVPFTVVGVSFDGAFRQFLIADLSVFLVRAFVQPGVDFQARLPFKYRELQGIIPG